jgi:hypothetical protein
MKNFEKQDSDIQEFVYRLMNSIRDVKIPPRVDKAIKMFRKQKNLLYLDKNPEQIKAVIKSQTNPDQLDYAVCISKNGNFFCGTQNLRPCGGLRGKICKHIILALIAAIKSGEANIEEMISWVNKTSSSVPRLNRSAATEIFIRFKLALDGEIEWRPVEIYPEDFMSI